MSTLDLKNAQLCQIFPSSLLQYVWAESDSLNQTLKQLILFKESQDEGISTTNVGGWHSKKDLHSWGGECILTLMNRILEMGQELTKRFYASENVRLFEGWTVEAWANINRRGDFNKYHHHIRNANLWSGVYYVDDGLTVEDVCGPSQIVFANQHRPEPLNIDEFRTRYKIEPRAGLMLMFPSSLSHRVEPHLGHAERITVAFNLKNSNFTTINYGIVAEEANMKKEG